MSQHERSREYQLSLRAAERYAQLAAVAERRAELQRELGSGRLVRLVRGTRTA